jgi:hypothetical protein
MKKIKILLFSLVLILFISTTVKAQSYANGFAGNIGIVQDGIGGVFSYNYFLDRHDFIEAGVFITAANFKYVEGIKIPYNDFTLNLGYSKNVFWNYKNTFNVNIGAGGVFGYETVNKGDKELKNGGIIRSEPGFIYGAFIGLDVDYALTDKYSLTLRMNEFYHANSDLGEFVPFVGIGFRYYAN